MVPMTLTCLTFSERGSHGHIGLKYYVDAVESLLQHGLEPVLVLDFNVLGPRLWHVSSMHPMMARESPGHIWGLNKRVRSVERCWEPRVSCVFSVLLLTVGDHTTDRLKILRLGYIVVDLRSKPSLVLNWSPVDVLSLMRVLCLTMFDPEFGGFPKSSSRSTCASDGCLHPSRTLLVHATWIDWETPWGSGYGSTHLIFGLDVVQSIQTDLPWYDMPWCA